MAYNSGYGYALKALKRIRSRGIMEITLQMVLQEMQSPDFGRTPIFKITVPYATFITTGVEKNLTDIIKSTVSNLSDMVASGAKSLVANAPSTTMILPLLVGLGAIAYFAMKSKGQFSL